MTKKNALFPEVKEAIAFDTLWKQACEKVTALSGDIWTDTGEHDPGITLLQSATWNCSDLSYRASLSLNDILTQADKGTLFPEEFGPDQILTCNTVTAEDYRKALLDLHSHDIKTLDTPEQDFLFSDICLIKEPEESRFHWWYNTDKREYSFSQPSSDQTSMKITLRGNIWLSVVPTRYTQSLSPENKEKVDQCLNTFLAEHRNIGETVSRIVWLKPVTFNPKMTIELSDKINDINQVVAQIYQVTEAFLRPTISRYTTEQRRALGDPNDAIFEGPRLRHGWQQTQPSRISSAGYILNLSPLVNLLLAIPGVASLSTLSVDTSDNHITVIKEYSWCWQIADGYYPLLWGEDPLMLLASSNSPLILLSKSGISSPLNSQAMASYLTSEKLIETEPTVLPAGRFRDQTSYIPVGQRLPECYSLQLSASTISDSIRAVHQFLLPVDQLLADGGAELTLLPRLLAFKERGNAIRGTRWPYADTGVQQDIHQRYRQTLADIEQQDVAIFSEQDNQLEPDNFARELDFIQYLLGYFGTQRATLSLTPNLAEFLATQRAFLAQQPTLGYDRINIRIDKVSALQKRIAARIGLGSTCFSDAPDLGKLPFYLIEHRQLLPQLPDSSFNNEHTPTEFTVNEPTITLTQAGSAGKIVQGQLVDLIAIEGGSRFYVSRLLVIAVQRDSFTVSMENSKQLLYNLSRLQNAWESKNLRWQNSNVWLQDMDYRLNYAVAAQQPSDKRQRLLVSNPQTPYPAMANVGDVIVLRPADLQLSVPGTNHNHFADIDAEWQLEATIKAVDPKAGTLLIEKAVDAVDFPAEDVSFHYQWAFRESNYSTTDRFSFVVSAVLNRSLIESPKIVSDKLVAWIQETILSELPAHISLINHWFDNSSFTNFGETYERWQNNGMPLGDDAYTLMKMLTLGHLPITQLGIGQMRIATEAQRTEVVGSNNNQWNTNIILKEELFYVPKDAVITFEHNDGPGESNDR